MGRYNHASFGIPYGPMTIGAYEIGLISGLESFLISFLTVSFTLYFELRYMGFHHRMNNSSFLFFLLAWVLSIFKINIKDLYYLVGAIPSEFVHW